MLSDVKTKQKTEKPKEKRRTEEVNATAGKQGVEN